MISTELLPGTGLGAIVFGLTKDRVEALAGAPNSKETISYEDESNDETEVWHYDEQEVSFGFDSSEDWRLVTISITGDQFTLNGTALVGSTQLKMVDMLTELSGETLDVEDCSSAEAPSCFRIGCEGLSMNLWCEEGVVSEVISAPSFTEEDEIVWPEAGA